MTEAIYDVFTYYSLCFYPVNCVSTWTDVSSFQL